MTPDLVLWIYIVFLFAGGLVGFLKAGSKMSLIMASVFAALLALCALHIVAIPWLADGLLAFLLVFFGMRFAKGKKFMPNGLMTALTIAALLLRHV
ncbi:MAG: TMEM14 family protein [Verrucomicrobia bacterium]|nr:TMEM14 family protein [Verrucomicrobiota bacterium]